MKQNWERVKERRIAEAWRDWKRKDRKSLLPLFRAAGRWGILLLSLFILSPFYIYKERPIPTYMGPRRPLLKVRLYGPPKADTVEIEGPLPFGAPQLFFKLNPYIIGTVVEGPREERRKVAEMLTHMGLEVEEKEGANLRVILLYPTPFQGRAWHGSVVVQHTEALINQGEAFLDLLYTYMDTLRKLGGKVYVANELGIWEWEGGIPLLAPAGPYKRRPPLKLSNAWVVSVEGEEGLWEKRITIKKGERPERLGEKLQRLWQPIKR